MPPPPDPPAREVRGLSSTGATGSAAPVIRPTSDRTRTGSLLVLIGGGVVLLSTFLPRFTVSGPGGTRSLGGVEGAGIGMLLLAGLAVAKGLEGLRQGTERMRLGSPILTGAFMAGVLALRWNELQNGLDEAAGIPGVSASIGSGFWLSVTGVVLVLCGGALIRFGDRAR